VNSIQEYLDALRVHLAGADPALIQDAVYDAEEFLHSETEHAPGDAAVLAQAIEAYGMPDEVAQSYLETERTVAEALRRPVPRADRSALARFFGVVADPSAYAALFYMFLAFVSGIVYFVLAVTGLSLSLGLMVLIIGVPVALLFIAAVRAISLTEGRVVEGLLGTRMPRRPRVVQQQGNMGDRLKSWFTDYRTWTTLLYMVLQLPLGIVYFTLVVTGLSVSLALVSAPVAQIVTGQAVIHDFNAAYYMAPWFMPVVMASGALLYVLTLHGAKLIGQAHAAYAKVMLVGRPMEGGTETTTAAVPESTAV
jgi:uncharacterized membrane protein